MRLKLLIFFGFVCSSLFARGQEKYQTTKAGLRYIIYSSRSVHKAKLGDIITFQYVITNYLDSELVNSYIHGKPYSSRLDDSTFGSMTEGFLMLGKGDSAAFFISADSMTKGHPNPALKSGTLVKYTIKMLRVQSGVEYESELRAKQVRAAQIDSTNKESEQPKLLAYIKENAPNAIKTKSGLYYIIEKEGTGPTLQPWDTAVVHYSGTLINGKEFDNDHGETFKFRVNVEDGQEGGVIKGWEEAFLLLKKGSKAKLIIPSGLAYGDRSFENIIPSYSTLIFEVEVVDVK